MTVAHTPPKARFSVPSRGMGSRATHINTAWGTLEQTRLVPAWDAETSAASWHMLLHAILVTFARGRRALTRDVMQSSQR